MNRGNGMAFPFSRYHLLRKAKINTIYSYKIHVFLIRYGFNMSYMIGASLSEPHTIA